MKLIFERKSKFRLGVSFTRKSVELNLGKVKFAVEWGTPLSWEETIPKRIVVAGSYREYLDWIVQTGKNPHLYRYVSVPYAVTKMTSLEVYYVGNYYINPVWGLKIINRLKEQGHVLREVYER